MTLPDQRSENGQGLTETAPLFSVTIPAYNEAALLPRLLDSIEVARNRYRGGPAAVEVVIGNNASTDATAAIARERGCTVVDVARRTIGCARNGAARGARGSIFCFVDADSIIHPETFNEIKTVMDAGSWSVGASGVRMERMSPGIAATWMIMLPMILLFRIDTGVVFCRREDYEAIGGYREDILAVEDADFMMRLKRLGRKRGARFVRLPTARTITSTRKFDRHGDWHYFPMVLMLPIRYLLSRQAGRNLALRYWYQDR